MLQHVSDRFRHRSIGGLHYILPECDPPSAAAGEHWSLTSADVVNSSSSPLDVAPVLPRKSPEVDCTESSVGAERRVSVPESSSTEHDRSEQRASQHNERCRVTILPQVNSISGYVAPASTAKFSDARLCGTFQMLKVCVYIHFSD
jgi:hypothetical protein